MRSSPPCSGPWLIDAFGWESMFVVGSFMGLLLVLNVGAVLAGAHEGR